MTDVTQETKRHEMLRALSNLPTVERVTLLAKRDEHYYEVQFPGQPTSAFTEHLSGFVKFRYETDPQSTIVIFRERHALNILNFIKDYNS